MTKAIRVVKHVYISGRWPTSRQHLFGRYVREAYAQGRESSENSLRLRTALLFRLQLMGYMGLCHFLGLPHYTETSGWVIREHRKFQEWQHDRN